MSETPIQTSEAKPKKKSKASPLIPLVPRDYTSVLEIPETEHYETRAGIKVHRIPRDSLLENRFAYNPSILEVGNTIFMAYRYAIPGMTQFNTAIAICELDRNWNVKSGSNRKLELIRRQTRSTTFDDPRLFMHQGHPYITYVNGMLMPTGRWSSSIFVADLDKVMNDRTYLSNLPNIGDNLNAATVQNAKVACEKNWTPFEVGGNLYFVYTINPLVVYQYDVAAGTSKLISTTAFDQSFWKHGTFLAGGTPLARIDDELVGFFHSYTNDNPEVPTERTYHVGFWAMSAQAPFKVTRMSRSPFMTAKKDPKRELRHEKSPWLPNCIFPGGFIERGDKLFIAQGWQDCTCEIVETTWDAVLKDVVEVK